MSTALGSDMGRKAPLPFSPDSPRSCKVAWNTCIFFPSSLAYLFRCFGQLLWSCLTSVWSAQASTVCPSKYSARLKSECSAWLRSHSLSIKVQFPAHFLEEIIPGWSTEETVYPDLSTESETRKAGFFCITFILCLQRTARHREQFIWLVDWVLSSSVSFQIDCAELCWDDYRKHESSYGLLWFFWTCF